MKKKQNIEIHNEEVREIMQQIPGRILRWGLAVIFLIFISIILGSYFFTFNEIVSAPLIITTTNPPAPLITKTSGRIKHWFVSDGDIVHKGDKIALIFNSSNIEDVVVADSLVNKLEINLHKWIDLSLQDNLVLGEIQDSYNHLFFSLKDLKRYLKHNILPQEIKILKQQLIKQEQKYKLALDEEELIKQQLEIAQKEYNAHEKMLDKGGISESKLESARSNFIQEKREYTNFLSSLKSSEISILNQKRSLVELQDQYRNEIAQYESKISDEINTFKDQVKLWKETYIVESPIDGKVTFTTFWSENHIVNSGDRLATVVPIDNTSIICRAVVASSGIGKVEIGQTVNIKLSGYPYMKHGILVGKVQSISLVPVNDGYIVEISLDKGMESSYKEQLRLVQEMDGTAEIITSEKRAIFRFVDPLRFLFSDS
ncbi:HlyD family efflux transporter periplasmic adaptor subunit [uncultured Draconibacterium sp.]|uniref:HlyD family efflux transporter periplasmic adaptor subunit n=1 Tax=uncultured Draconibacterium sp. TaxID=1573823 RepID=UPI0029C68712|nr:HlyD family efflux transporter periplasmic adaptor subunit [uncultured Draconibacterium sp.]